MNVLFIVSVLAGCLLPFLCEKDEKDKIITCIMMLGDLLLIVAMVHSDIAYLVYLGKPESIAVAACLMLLSIAIKKMQILTANNSHPNKAPRTHHQEVMQKQNHKAAS